MFEDSQTAISAYFPSSWYRKKAFKDGGTQATPSRPVDVAVQAHGPFEDVGVQTGEFSDAETPSASSTKVDSSKLRRFLERVMPLVEAALERNESSHAFEGYQVSWEDEVDSIDCKSELFYPCGLGVDRSLWGFTSDGPKKKNEDSISSSSPKLASSKPTSVVDEAFLSAACVGWNCTGSILGVAYGGLDHQGWCVHPAALCMWSVFRDPKPKGKKPDVIIDTESCLLSIAFHPKVPTLIVGGNFNGGISVWDLNKSSDTILSTNINSSNNTPNGKSNSSNTNAASTTSLSSDEPLVASSRSFDPSKCHREPIAKVEWSKSSSIMSSIITSIGSDGKIIQWSLSKRLETSPYVFEPLKSFTLMQRPSAMIGGGTMAETDSGAKSAVVGGTAMSFSTEDDFVFIAGTEAGRVYKCSSNIQSSAAVPSLSPITFSYDPHVGPVLSLSFSPFHRNLFLSAGQDTSLRLFSLLKSKPLIHYIPSEAPILDVAWSSTRPLVFAAASADDNVYFYDLKRNRVHPVATLKVSDFGVCSISFSKEAQGYFVTGDLKGVAKVWRLSDLLVKEVPGEKSMLLALGES